MSARILFAVMACAAMLPTATAAYSAPTEPQSIKITINRDYTATGTWRIPYVRTPSDLHFYVPQFISYGYALSTRYSFASMQESYSKKPVYPKQMYDEWLALDVDPLDQNVVQMYDVTLTMTPYFKQPVAIYEFWIAGGSSRIDPRMHITFPNDWKILSLWPSEATTSSNSIGINYASSHPEVKPVIVVFQTHGQGVVRQFGKYTVSGAADEVEKIVAALALIPSVDETMSNTVSIKTPDKVLIISDNLSSVGQVGFEAEAIAANPNVIVFNNQLTKSRTTEELAETLSHELSHLAVLGVPLFKGRPYRAPLFDEGLAVYFQNVMHKKIFTDANKRILNEDLNRTHVASPSEATVLYETGLDSTFDGSRPLGTSASYAHAGLVFGRFADVSGSSGFKSLFKDIEGASLNAYNSDASDVFMQAMSAISGLSLTQLKFPGKTENNISGIVGRITHAESDEDVSADIITAYIRTGIKHYFANGSTPTQSASAPVQSTAQSQAQTPTQGVATVKITKVLTVGSKGAEVTALQNFLESKGFLAAGLPKGTFGRATKAALMAYQKSAGILQTGTTGPKTRAAINSASGQ